MRDGWDAAPLGKFIKQSKKKVKVQVGIEYPAIGVMMEGRGFVTRPPFVGGKTTYKQLTPIEANQLVLRSITAWEAPIQVTTEVNSGFHVSGVFPVFDIDSSMLNPKFLSLLCRYEPFWESMRERTVGSVLRRKTLSASALMEIPVQLPPLPHQKRIVDLISSVDSYIEALKQQSENTKRSRRAVLHELLTAGGGGWIEATLGEMTDLVRGPYGGSLKKEIFVQEGLAVYEQQHAIYGDFSTIRYRISREKFDEMKRFSLLPGDLIMSCSGTMGKVRIVPKEAESGIINQALLKIKPKSNLIGDFLYLWMQSEDFTRQIEINSGGGALQNVSSVKMLKGIKLIVPDLVEQERIIDIISTIDKVIIKTELVIDKAKNLRAGLLSNLLSGEHEIPASYDKVLSAA